MNTTTHTPAPNPQMVTDTVAIDAREAVAAQIDLRQEIEDLIENAMIDAKVDWPSERGAGHQIDWDRDGLMDGIMACVVGATTPVPVEAEGGAQYVIWSNEHNAWWGADERGYCTALARAGRYTRDAALAICTRARRAPPQRQPDRSAPASSGCREVLA